MRYLLGLDIGTTNIKSIVIAEDGKVVAYASKPTPIEHPRREWSEFAPDKIWNAVCSCILEIGKQCDLSLVVSIGISSMAETGIPVDDLGNPLYNFIAWYDFRAERQAAEQIDRIGMHRLYAITGQIPSAKYGITKLKWLLDEVDGIRAGIAHWLSMEDYIIYKLTGCIATDYSIASRTMAFDINAIDWSDEILCAVGLCKEIFPKALPGGTCVSTITGANAQMLHLPISCAVCTGGHDHACAAIAVGVTSGDVLLDSMGTAESSMIAVAHPQMGEYSFAKKYSFYPHCGARLYRVLSSIQCCGAAIEWYLKAMGNDIVRESAKKGISKYDEMVSRIPKNKRSAEGLLFVPLLRGTVEQKGVHGQFWGIRDDHFEGDFIAALYEGICNEYRYQTEGLSELCGGKAFSVRAVGGLSQSRELMQVKANVHGERVIVPVNREAAVTGAALLGGVGQGCLQLEGLSDMRGERLEFMPEKENAGYQQKKYELYRSVRNTSIQLYKELSSDSIA